MASKAPITTAYRTSARITAVGSYLPERVLSNDDLEKMVDTNDEWIVQRTGIRERRIAADDEYTSDLCFHAVRDLVDRYPDRSLEDVDYILVATATPDTFFPQTAARVQAEFGIRAAGAADVAAACAGFVSALQLAGGLIASGMHRKILVIGAETLSRITDYADRTTCILFGDGAGAVLVEAGASDSKPSWLHSYARTDGEDGHHLYRSSLSPSIGDHRLQQSGKIVQNGRAVFRWAISRVPESILEMLDEAGAAPEDIDWFVPHNPNMRILDVVSEKTGIPLDKTITTLERTGNTSAASIPLALSEGVRSGRIRDGQLLLLYGFGGGLSQSGLLIRWMA
ncbi:MULTISPECIES: ketoacyl-ACP synthase III [unclassified Paenibacillus]|uniref:ketoacyl-ACP synthase III n=1 Tax=unclassified Paenibacillus TaxID=185978 RepID=UPI000954FE0F|nr:MULTISPECIES: ketoacyl-ACP synthase III [unclassified Paenibacillus]ASS69003.1 ketoacyl-ACP synthase III [Paenibacillus sp. RUD330]SIR11092.1 3-oxoacyl-[acyl-carrier-protein] synthase-3 [Paenibacillus sp. RU4X]SIR25770.1 3-oxoacyl-[acyl-carrier-protein] synthase-3 [Paenibacillus sp. RU4T]